MSLKRKIKRRSNNERKPQIDSNSKSLRVYYAIGEINKKVSKYRRKGYIVDYIEDKRIYLIYDGDTLIKEIEMDKVVEDARNGKFEKSNY